MPQLRRVRTFTSLAALVVVGALGGAAAPADAAFQRTFSDVQRYQGVLKDYPNYFTEMAIGDVGHGTGPSLARDGRPDVVGISRRTGNGRLFRIAQTTSQQSPWQDLNGDSGGSGYVSKTLVTTFARPELRAANGGVDLMLYDFGNAYGVDPQQVYYEESDRRSGVGLVYPGFQRGAMTSFDYGRILSSPNPTRGLATLDANGGVALSSMNDPFNPEAAPGTPATTPTRFLPAAPAADKLCNPTLNLRDVSNDGITDVVVWGTKCDVGANDSGFQVWLGQAGVDASTAYRYDGYVSLGAGLRDMQFGDLNGDGRTDLAFTFAASLTAGGGEYAIALGNTNATLDGSQSLKFGFLPNDAESVNRTTVAGGAGALKIADVAPSPAAGNGTADLVIGQPQSKQVRILTNGGNGRVFAATVRPTPFGDGTVPGPDGIDVAPIDGDGRPDLLAWATTKAANGRDPDVGDWEVFTGTRGPTVGLAASATKAFKDTQSVSFTATATAPAGSPTDAVVDHVDWDFDGDGTADQTTAGLTVAHTFTTIGLKNVKVTVTNEAGDSTTAGLQSPLVVGTPLTVTLSPASATTTPGAATDFTATATGGYPGPSGAVAYSYAFTSDATTTTTPFAGVLRATWAAARSGSVGVTATDGQGQSTTGASVVRVANPMTASVAPQNARNLMAGEARTLVASASGGIPPLTYAWDLDDDGTYETDTGSSNQTPVTFPASGTKVVGLRVTDADTRGGLTKTTSATLTVRPALDAMLTRTPVAPAPGAAVTLSAADSTGGEPVGAAPSVYTYAWTLDGAPLPGETGPTLQRTFATPGRHTVGLTITDAYGRTDGATSAFTVADPLVADFSNAPLDPQLGETVTFDAAPTTGGLAPRQLRWDLDGDGAFEAAANDDPTPTFTYGTTGIRTITLRVTDDDGKTSTVRRPLGIAAELTTAFRVLPAQPRPGQVTTFDGGITVGGTRPYTYEWTLDGTVLTDAADATDQLTRTFAQPGHHTVSLEVTDKEGRVSAAAEQDVRVADPLVAEFASTPAQPETGQVVTFDAKDASGGVPPLAYAWDRDGNGSYETSTGGQASDAFAFDTAGVHVVGLKVTDADGETETVSHNVTVAPALRAALTHAPEIPVPGAPVKLDASRSGGGVGALGYAFDLDSADTFAVATGAAPTTVQAFATKGDHAVAVRVRDQGGHEQVARDVVTVADPLKAALAITPANPETGDTLRVDATGSAGGVGALSFAFDLDGNGVADGDATTTATASRKVDEPGPVRLGVQVSDTRGQKAGEVAGTNVTPRLEPAFSVPAVVTDDLPTTFDAAPTTGGAAPVTFRWDLDGNGSYETTSGTRSTQDGRFPKPGSYTVGLQVGDALGHVRDVRKTFRVVTGCVQSLDLGLAQIRAASGVCMRRTSGSASAPFTADGDLIVNGMKLARQAGATLQVFPADGTASPRIVSTGVKVTVDGANVVDGAIDWRLPTGEPGDERAIAGVGLGPKGVKLLGLEAEGRIAFALGANAAGTPYVRVSTNLVIPGFKLTDDKNSPGITGKFSFRIDKDGPHFDAAKVRVTHAKLKGLDVNDICLSYVAAGQDGDGCEQFSDHSGEPFLTCKSDDKTNRWNGTMDITLPASDDAGFAFSGELQDGSLANVAAKAELGHTVPIGEGVYLKSIAAGVCLKPPPLQVRGQAVISAIPTGSEDAIEVSGGFLYVDAVGKEPWKIELNGGLTVFDHHIADGRAALSGDGSLAFGLNARLQLPNDDVNLASIEGRIDGWMKGRAFNVEGSVKACLLSAICRSGEALVSSDGVSACATIITLYYPVVDVGWLYADVHFESYDVRGGFGYRWGGSLDAMGGSCDIGPWRPAGAPVATRSQVGGSQFAVRAQVGGSPITPQHTFDVGQGSIVETLKVGGADGAAPDVVVTGPDGTRLETTELLGQAAPQELGKSLVMKDPVAGSTILQLIKPAAGTWTIAAKPGSMLGELERAQLQLPPAIGGRVRKNKSGHHLDFAYTPQPGVELKFIERRGTFTQPIGSGKLLDRCTQSVDRRTKRDITLKCGRVDFTPADGPAGKRQIDVQITRDGVPVSTEKVATFTVKPPAPPSRVRATIERRPSGYPKLSWTKSRRAVGYEVTATSPEGYRQAWKLPAKCLAVTLPVTQAARSVKVTVEPIAAKNRPAGQTTAVKLASKKKTAGAKRTGRMPRSCQ